MHDPDEAPQAHHSAFAAAFLSFLLPGLGQMYAGRWRRGASFMVPWLLAVGLIAGTASSMGLKQFGLRLGLDTTWLQYLLAGITIDLVWRLIAIVDAFRVARGPEDTDEPRIRRIGSVAGLVAVIAVLVGSHVTIAAPAYGQYDALRCATDPDCVGRAPDPTDDPVDTGDGLESLPPVATLPPVSLPPGATATPEPSLGFEPTALPYSDGGRLNVLLIGVNGALTDTLIVVSIDPDTRQVAFIGIPRDTLGFLVPRSLGKAAQHYSGVFPARVNQIFGEARANRLGIWPGDTPPKRGFTALTQMIGATLDIPITYYVRVDMGGFRDVVDTLMPGGAIVDAQRPLYDSRYSSDDGRGAIKLYVPPGIHSMNGAEALAYTRSRHSSSDFDRSARQMRLITALRDQVDIPSLVSDIGQLQQIIKQDIKTDIPPADMSRLASLVQGIDLDKRISLQLAPPFSTQCKAVPSHPLCQVAHNAPYGYVPDIAAIQRAVKNVFSTDPKTIERQQALASEAAVVHVLNGTRATNQRTTNVSDRLVQEGLGSSVPPVNAGKADRTDYPDTVITAYNGVAEDMPVTTKLLEDLFGVTIATADDASQMADFVVVVGKSTPRLKPRAGQ